MPWEKDLCNFPEKGSCTIDTNKLVLFVHFDNTNKISDTDILYLQKLKKISAKLVFITNSKLNDADIELAGRLSDLVIERPNQGYDFGAWKDALAIIGSSGITEFTQVVLVNNSCFAPATDLTMMFMEMEKEKADFWGNSIYPAVQEIIDLQNNKRKINTPEHIQSYFLVFNPRIIKSVDFNEFWLHIPYINSLNDVIKECEINLTPYFSSRGYTYSCYIKETITQQLHNGVDCSYKDPCQLIEWGSPFLKKKSLKFISDSHKNILSSYFLQKNNINILQKE